MIAFPSLIPCSISRRARRFSRVEAVLVQKTGLRALFGPNCALFLMGWLHISFKASLSLLVATLAGGSTFYKLLLYLCPWWLLGQTSNHKRKSFEEAGRTGLVARLATYTTPKPLRRDTPAMLSPQLAVQGRKRNSKAGVCCGYPVLGWRRNQTESSRNNYLGPPILAHAHTMIELRWSTGCSDLQTWSLLERAPLCVCVCVCVMGSK